MAKYAVVDIGTNSILLLVAQKTDGSHPSLVPILDQAKTVRLGEDLLSTGCLCDHAIERTLTGLKIYLSTIEVFSLQKILCFGTEALRRAKNADTFCQRVNHELGLEVQILNPAAEASYTFQGAISSLSASEQFTKGLVIDIGGGSTEIVYGAINTIEYQQSFSMGAVVVKEKFKLKEQLTSTEFKTLQAYIGDICKPLPTVAQNVTVLITGGTATTLAALDQQLVSYDIASIDGYCMQRSSIEVLYNQLNQLSLEQRAALAGMEPGRADIILPALVILLTLLDSLDIYTVQISVRGARYGILLGRELTSIS